MINKHIVLFCLLIITSLPSFAQKNGLNNYYLAREQYQKKNFAQAFEYYDKFYSDTTHGKSNWDCYYAAVAACQSGRSTEAKRYLKDAIEIRFEAGDYYSLYNDSLNVCLRELPEWKTFIGKLKFIKDSTEAVLRPIRQALYDTTLRVNQSVLTKPDYWEHINSAKKLISVIKNFNDYPMPVKSGYWTLYYIKQDTLTVPFLLYIPVKYNTKMKTPLYVFLHGGVSGKKSFFLDAANTVDAQRNLMKKIYEQNAFILFPFAKSNFNWLNVPAAFEAIIKEIVKVKSLYNIDDNKVYLGGYSDGGRGAFWFALNDRTPFASFFSMNYFPQLQFGNTALRNLNNLQPFYGLSGRFDAGMPLSNVTSIYNYARKNGANWTNYTINGEHGLPYTMPDSVYFLFKTLINQVRNPFPKKIVWETDNVKNGRCFWLEITQLDTLKEKAVWQNDLNPTLTHPDGKEVKMNFTKNKSGAIAASIKDNIVTIQQSRVKEIIFYASAELVDLSKPVIIYVDGKQVYKGIIKEDKKIIEDEFLKTKDRSIIVVNKIRISL